MLESCKQSGNGTAAPLIRVHARLIEVRDTAWGPGRIEDIQKYLF
jgi:hypothetical protein